MKNLVEDIYPLSPMQQGMLFHTVLAPEGGDYVTQLAGTIEGAATLAALEDAWQQVIRRHPILRTGFVWEGFEQPLQVVYREAGLDCERRDWKQMRPADQAQALEQFLDDDRSRGFDLSIAPLMRLTVFELATEVYRFVWTHHHLLLDGWSLPIVMRELFTFAEASLQGHTVELPSPQPYRQYIGWLGEQDESAAERYWRGVLAGFATPTPLGRVLPQEPRYGATSKSHREIRRWVPSGVTEQLGSFARKHQLTLNTVVQGAWSLLLSRHNSVSDVVFGATVCGRPPQLAGVESMVGLFINTQPVRCKVDPGADLVSWLQGIQNAQMEARRFEHCRLASIHGWSEVPRGLPIFESVVIFENYPAGAFSGLSRAIPIRDVRVVETTNFPLALIAAPGDALELRLNYDTGRFDESAIVCLMGQLQTLLEGIAADPQCRLSDLPVLTAKEQQQLTVEWNRTSTPYPDRVCAHEWFEQQAARNPETIAVVFEEEALSYGELNRRANQLAHALRCREVGPEVLVAVALERSPEMIVAILGVMKAGGAYLPIAVDQPVDRIGFVLKDACPRVMVSSRGLRERLKECAGRCEWLAMDDASIGEQSTDNPASVARPGNLAYVIYTSGSTGRPKGVMIEHRGLCNLAQAQGRLFAAAPGSRVLQFAAASFDASVSEIFVTLLNGATLYLARREQLLGTELAELLRRQEISVATLPPTVLATLRNEELPSLRTLVVAGEACGAELIRRWSVGRRMLNAYGPTEATVCATAWECDPQSSSVSIGRPIDNARVYIVDAQMRPVPVGTAGELLIGGVGVARGYLQRPELTRERFVGDPFSTEAGARLYRTGDRARYSSDGLIEFVGRMDRQLKIRGFRIEPGEIETVLEEQESVAKAVVIDREDVSGKRRVVAYVTGRGGSTLAVGELRAALKHKLPDYMVPSSIVVLDELPLTAHGKVDLSALPAPGTDRPEMVRPCAVPRNAVEEALLGIWKEVLGLAQIGIHDNFFDLGGHSLLAMQLVSRLGEDLGVEAPVQLIFSAPTLAGVVERLMEDPVRRPGLIRAAELLVSTAGLSDDDLEAMMIGARLAA